MKLSEADKLLDRVEAAPRHVRKAIKEEMERQTYREQTEKQFWNTKEFARWLGRSERYVVVHRHEMPCAHREGRLWHFDKEIAFRRKAAGKSQFPFRARDGLPRTGSRGGRSGGFRHSGGVIKT